MPNVPVLWSLYSLTRLFVVYHIDFNVVHHNFTLGVHCPEWNKRCFALPLTASVFFWDVTGPGYSAWKGSLWHDWAFNLVTRGYGKLPGVWHKLTVSLRPQMPGEVDLSIVLHLVACWSAIVKSPVLCPSGCCQTASTECFTPLIGSELSLSPISCTVRSRLILSFI